MSEQNKKTLTELIDFHLKVGQTVTVHLYNKSKLVLTFEGQLKREDCHGQFYIKTEHCFLIFTDNGYDDYEVYTTNPCIKLRVF